MKILLVCLLFFLASFSAVFAQDGLFSAPSGGQLNEALEKSPSIRFLPDHPLYFSITIKENVESFFKPSALIKAEFDFMRSSKRLKESYLLFEKNADGQEALKKYSQRIRKSGQLIDKANSQNQETSVLIDIIAHDLVYQEQILLYLMSRDIDEVDDAISAFSEMVKKVDLVKPGLKNRYILFKEEEKQIDVQPSPSPTIEATPSYRPKRIIY